MKKRGVSALIATVLLILMTIAAAGVIYGFIMPMIKGNIEASTKCADAALEIGGYTCYNSANNEVQIEVGRGEKSAELSGIQLVVSGEGKSISRTVESGKRYLNVTEYNNAYNVPVTLPGPNEARTYVINLSAIGITSPEIVSAAAIVKVANKDKLCGAVAQQALSIC